MADERSSSLDESAPFVEPNEYARARLEAENGLRQFDRLVEMIETGIRGRFRLRPSTLMELNRIAVEGLEDHLAAQLVDVFNVARGEDEA